MKRRDPIDRHYGRPRTDGVIPMFVEPQEITKARRARQSAAAARRRAMNESFRGRKS